MRKKLILIISTILIAAALLACLCACESYKTKPLAKNGNPKAPVESNGGLVVKQGNYLYFVNGYTGYLTEKGKDNWFGNVTKGAIVRVTYNSDGTLGNDYTVVVPKSIMSDSTNVGFSIFGNYIYYTSPCAEEDRSGKVKTNIIQFMRTKLDGTGTQVIMNCNDSDVKYKYTANALVWYDDNEGKIYSKKLSNKKFDKKGKGACIASDVTSVYFPACDSYTPNTGRALNDYILYTVSATGDYDYSNTLYICDSNGGNKVAAINGATAFGDKKNKISLISTSIDNGKLAIYYSRDSYVGVDSTGNTEGTFAYQFQDNNFTFDAANEKKLSSSALSKLAVLGYDAGIISLDSNVVIYYTNGTNPELYKDLTFEALVCVANGKFFYVDNEQTLLYYAVDKSANAQKACPDSDKVMKGFTGAEYFDGYIYFIMDDDYNYVYRVKADTCNVYDPDGLVYERVAKVTCEDQKKMDAEKKD